jgi:ketosteroid isomerase-like protein
MKRLVLVALAVLALSTTASAQGIDKTLMDLERQWIKAALASNGEALAPLLTADFVSLQADGATYTKAETVARTSKSKWQVSEVSEMKVLDHGNAAVVTGVWTGKGTDGAGKAIDGRERFADTWVKTNAGKWQCVVSASAPLK